MDKNTIISYARAQLKGKFLALHAIVNLVRDSEERFIHIKILLIDQSIRFRKILNSIPQANIKKSSWKRIKNNRDTRGILLEKEQHAKLMQVSGTSNY